jgi:cob(I)alamin adenosyltransferase
LETAADAVASGKYSLVILDEIIVAIEFKLIPIGRVLEILKNKPEEVNIILTGRNAQPEIIELADMVSEIREIKHHYSQGIKGKTGIEY